MERRILVAGGDRFAAVVLKDICTEQGWPVHRLDRAGDAVQAASGGAPSALVLFADEEGFEVCARMSRRTGQWPAILMVAGRIDGEAQLRALDCGADDCLPFPFDPVEVVGRLARAMAFRRLAVELPARSQPPTGPEENLEDQR